MHILILGGTGMLGHKLFQHLRERFPETYCTIRGSIDQPLLSSIDLFHAGGVIERCDAGDSRMLEKLLLKHRPRVVINCIGVVKQRAEAKKAIPSIAVNALLPHLLAGFCDRWGGKLIHFSTDCVFSGKCGSYQESDITDAEDLYGRTKALGEIIDGKTLTLRTSIIGRELTHSESLLEWVLRQEHKHISGYTRAMYSGITTNYMARMLANLIEAPSSPSGLFQVTSDTISKFDLLCLLKEAYGLDVAITPDPKFFCDRSMKGDKFKKATGQVCPAWPDLVAELANDDTPYDRWKQVQAAAF
jgi:dTDP-4-dehydrorhamnose reductase